MSDKTRMNPHTPRTETTRILAAFSITALVAITLVGAAPAVAEIIYDTTACGWSPKIKESAGVEFKCAGQTVLDGIKHSGDENGDTKYQCCSLTPQNVSKAACAWSREMKEANSNYTCPGGQAMVGRWHNKDENGPTKYYCCNLNNPAGQVLPDDTTCYWSNSDRQSKSDLKCGAGEVMRGRSHQGDENGPTEIYCCKFKGES